MTATAQWALLTYGVLMVLGGILGYVLPKKPSKISLISGGSAGILSVVAFFISRFDTALPGLAIGLVVSAGVGVMMFLRYQETKKFLPGGLVALLSAVVALLVASALSFP